VQLRELTGRSAEHEREAGAQRVGARAREPCDDGAFDVGVARSGRQRRTGRADVGSDQRDPLGQRTVELVVQFRLHDQMSVNEREDLGGALVEVGWPQVVRFASGHS
jgi:hypothetical protein